MRIINKSHSLWSSLSRQSKHLAPSARTVALLLSFILSAVSYAEMAALSDDDMQETTGREGLTLSMKLDFAEGTRISYKNNEADYKPEMILKPNKENWLVIDNITGSIEAKQMHIDLEDNYDGSGQAVSRVTYPEKIVFKNFKTDGFYLGPDQEKTAEHRFIVGLEIDGTLEMPAQTQIRTFVTTK